MNECLPVLTRACKSSTIRSLKTIRLTAQLTEILLQRDSSVKVVYYTRDPRGISLSRATLSNKHRSAKKVQFYKNASKMICVRMRTDIRQFAAVKKKHKILQLRYEDLANRPHDSVNHLYRFIGSEVPENVVRWIGNNTQSASDNGIMGTRRNSSTVPEKWRRRLTQQSKNAIEANCIDVLRALGLPLY